MKFYMDAKTADKRDGNKERELRIIEWINYTELIT